MKDFSVNQRESFTLLPEAEDANLISSLSAKVNISDLAKVKPSTAEVDDYKFSDLKKMYQKKEVQVEVLRKQITSCGKGRAGRSKKNALNTQYEEAIKRRDAIKELLKGFPVSEYLKAKKVRKQSGSSESVERLTSDEKKPGNDLEQDVVNESEFWDLCDEEQDADFETWTKV